MVPRWSRRSRTRPRSRFPARRALIPGRSGRRRSAVRVTSGLRWRHRGAGKTTSSQPPGSPAIAEVVSGCADVACPDVVWSRRRGRLTFSRVRRVVLALPTTTLSPCSVARSPVHAPMPLSCSDTRARDRGAQKVFRPTRRRPRRAARGRRRSRDRIRASRFCQLVDQRTCGAARSAAHVLALDGAEAAQDVPQAARCLREAPR